MEDEDCSFHSFLIVDDLKCERIREGPSLGLGCSHTASKGCEENLISRVALKGQEAPYGTCSTDFSGIWLQGMDGN